MRIIDADALKKLLMLNNKTTQDVIYAVIDSVPTVDAVQVVRCGECKHKNSVKCPAASCGSEKTFYTPFEIDFCSYGERKDGAE